VYKAEKTNDYSLVGDAVQAVKDVGYSSAIGKELSKEYEKLESRVNNDINEKFVDIDFNKLTEIDNQGIERADVAKISDLSDEIATSMAEGDEAVRQLVYEKLFDRAENNRFINESIKRASENEVIQKLQSDKLSSFQDTNESAIKFKTEASSSAKKINDKTESELNTLSQDYTKNAQNYFSDLQSKVSQGLMTAEDAQKDYDSYNQELYKNLKEQQNLIVNEAESAIKGINELYSQKIQKGYEEFSKNNLLSQEERDLLSTEYGKIYEEIRDDEFKKLKGQETLDYIKYGGGTGLAFDFGKSLNSTLSRAISGAGTYFGSPSLVEIGDEMNTSFTVADEPLENWSDLANIPAVTKSIGRLAGSAAPSIIIGSAVSASTAGLGTVPAMALVATTGFVTESIDMAGNIKRDVIRETGSLLKGEQAAGAMWEAQMGNWWTYLGDGLPFVSKALKFIPSKTGRILTAGGESVATETPQEIFQTSQEQKIMESVRSGEEISAKGFMELITPELATSTFLEVAPGSLFLGGGSRVVTEVRMQGQANQIVKDLIDNINLNGVDKNQSFIKQKIFSSINRHGKNFTNSWLSTLQENGVITEEQLTELYTFSKTAEGFSRNIKNTNLTDEQQQTYFGLSHRANELFDKADAITDDKVLKSSLTQEANELKKNAQSFLSNPETGGSFVTIKIGKSPALVLTESEAIEFVTNNPYVAFPNSGVTIKGRNVDEFTRIFGEMAQGAEAGLADLKSIDDYGKQQSEEGRLSSVDNTLTKVNNAEYINDNEIDSSIDQIFDEVDRVDGLDISDNAKESIKQQLFSIAETLDNYEFRTKTETRKVTPEQPVEGRAEAKREIPKKSTSKAEIPGVGTVNLTFTGRNTISITPKGQEGTAARVTTFTFPENFLYTNEEGDFTALVIEDAEGNQITINDPDIGVPLAINNIINETAAVPTEVVEEFVAEEINYIKERKEAAPKAKEAAPVEGSCPNYRTSTEAVTELSEEQLSELNKFLGLDKSKRKASRKGRTKKDNQRLDKVERAVDLLKQSLSEVMPNIVISVAEDSDMFARFAGEQSDKKEDRSKGLFTRIDGIYVIVLNPDSADVTTVFHEGLHAVLRAAGLPSAQARAVTTRMVEAVKKTATKKLQRELEAFTDLYETPLKSQEYIAELTGILANNYNEQNNETKSIIRRWLQKLAEMLGLKPKGVSLSTVGLNNTDAATIDALNFVAKKMSEGGVLTEQDLTRLTQPGEEQQGDGSEETVTRKQKRKKPKNIKELLDVMEGVFGLNKTQSESVAVVGDVLVETMAKRAGVSKEEMYQIIAYAKAQKAPDGSLKQESPLFKSTAKEGLSKIQQKAATPEQWVKMINDKGGKGTSQELEWIGLQDYLNEWKKENNAKSVPKEVVEQYINDNQIEIVEVTKGGSTPKYSNYTLEGGENYREVLLAMPPPKIDYEANQRLLDAKSQELFGKPYSELERFEITEVTRKTPLAPLKGENYKSSHWDESNILAHLRLNERTLPNGERVMFIEEVQSDWAQEGKKKGFISDLFRGNFREFVEKEKGLRLNEEELLAEFNNNQGELKKEFLERTDRAKTPDMPYKKTDQWVGMAMRRAMQMASQEGFDRVAWVTGEQSADRYDLSKQVDRVEVADMLDGNRSVYISMKDNSDIQLFVDPKTGKILQSTDKGIDGKMLEDVVGKEISSKILNLNTEKESVISSEGLKIGGEGMKAFYNSILPKVASKEAKRFDKKANVEVVEVEQKQKDERYNNLIAKRKEFQEKADKSSGYVKDAYLEDIERVDKALEREYKQSKQLSILITPEMRMNLNSAVPLFQGARGAMTAADGNYVVYALTNPNVSTPLHELAHVYEHYLTDKERADIESWSGHNAGTVEFSEAFARGFEKFLAGGKVKNPRLQKIFENFKKWLTEIYNGIKGSEIDIQLNSKMESIYNDMLGAEETPVEAPVKETVTRKQKKKKPKSIVKDAFEWGIQKGVPAIAVKNHLIKLGYTEEEITSGAYDAEKIWNKDWKKVKNWFEYGRRSALSARKFRPQSMFLAQEAMESSISAELRQAKMMAEKLNRTINRYKSQDKRDELIDAVDEFMRDAEERDFWRNELPDDIAQIAEAMRIHIDSLSLKLVEVGAIKAESSRENILKNIGVYMNRSFEIFDNKNWKEEVSEQVITAAQNHLREAYYNSLSGIIELDQQLKDGKITESDYNRRKNRILANKASVKKIMDRDNVSEDEALTMHVEKVVDDILTRKDVDEYISFAKSVVGKKDLSSLKRRKDIPPAIRALMGEYTDPGYNYAMSIFKIANLVENQKYLTKIRDAGLGVWLFEDEAGIKKREGYKQITFDGDASMNPLDGLYAPEAVAEAFNDIELNRIISGIPVIGTPYKVYLKFVGGVKYSKTILSYGTHAKNVIGNMYFMAQNGYLDPREYQQPFIALVKQFSGKELTAEQEAKMDEWVRAGIIGQGATIGEIKSFFEGEDSFEKALTKRIDKKTDNMLDRVRGSKVGKGVKKFGEKAQEAYQYEDDMFKIVAYEKEKLNYSKILFDGKSYNQLDAAQKSTVNEYVAEIIKNILPNYGRIGGFGKFLKAVPIAGTFISFQLEAYRTAYNTVALAMQEIKGDIPGISETGKKLAQKRGVMRLMSIVGFQAFKYGLMSLLGIPLIPGDDDDEDGLSEKIRTLLPFWDTNSDISVREVKPNGNFTYVSISASDPYGSIFKVVNATKNFTKTGEGFSEIFGELAGPFISEEILLNTLTNIKNNKNDYGGKIWRNTDTPFEVSGKIALQLGKTFEPGAMTSTRKIIKSEDKLNEVLGQFTGFKLHEVKSLEQAGFKFGDIQNKAQESKSAYNSIKYNMDDYETQEDINKVIRASKKAMDKDYQEAVKLYQALISLGVSDADIKKKMYDSGISAPMRSQIARNSVDVKLNPIKK
jgi:hypothetical protein